MSKYTAKHSAARHVVMQPLHLQHPLHEYIRPRVLQPPDGECKGLKKKTGRLFHRTGKTAR